MVVLKVEVLVVKLLQVGLTDVLTRPVAHRLLLPVLTQKELLLVQFLQPKPLQGVHLQHLPNKLFYFLAEPKSKGEPDLFQLDGLVDATHGVSLVGQLPED